MTYLVNCKHIDLHTAPLRLACIVRGRSVSQAKLEGVFTHRYCQASMSALIDSDMSCPSEGISTLTALAPEAPRESLQLSACGTFLCIDRTETLVSTRVLPPRSIRYLLELMPWVKDIVGPLARHSLYSPRLPPCSACERELACSRSGLTT